jgi:DNA-3-methyladenine glycosylase
MKKILPVAFFDRPTLTVTRELLGKYLIRKWRGRKISLFITEVEAYDGPNDRASHASRGRTPRTKIMFGSSGRFYVYFTYGMHWLVNIVTGPKDHPAAILIRAGKYYDAEKQEWILVNGPARLTKFLHITGAQNGKIAGRKSGLWLEDRGIKIQRRSIALGKRVGVDYAGPFWSNKKWNFKARV